MIASNVRLSKGPAKGLARKQGTVSTRKQQILELSLELMAKKGVTGTSMRDIAAAASINIATLYHYFPSKADLLKAVLQDKGYLQELSGERAGQGSPTTRATGSMQSRNLSTTQSDAKSSESHSRGGGLPDLLASIMDSVIGLEDFVRLMLGESLRGDETALAVGKELLFATQASLERWIEETEPALCQRVDPASLARMLRALIVGLFFEHIAGTLETASPSSASKRRASREKQERKAILERAQEIAALLGAKS
jgi:AcrR family transcriptional regulator